jgi:chromosome segregation ATPase
MERLQMQNT